tara:strand:+ start:953 stop:1435 length:483 start_codon:yes stop_codon:yes gene_type:complete
MIKINVITNNIRWFSFIKKPSTYIDRRIERINKKNEIFKKKELFCTLLLSGNVETKNLNKKFRKKNKTTDVLSFPFQTKKELNKKLKKEKEIYLGDIIINLNKIKSKKEIKKFLIEFDRLWIHGLVHLFGYQHERDKDYLKMSRVEKNFLNLINNGKVFK